MIIPEGATSIGADAFKDADVTIAGTTGSTANTYATQNGLTFRTKMSFTDISESDWYYEAVSYVYYKGLMGNGSGSTFGALQLFGRGQMAVVLHCFDGNQEVEYMPLFPDVGAQDWYAQASTWANQTGVVLGNTNGYYEPTRNITRQDFVQILYRYVNYKGYDTSQRAE